MVERLHGLGLPGVTARTFHAHALSQLRHFWPSRHEGDPMPELLDSKLPILIPLVQRPAGPLRVHPIAGRRDRDRVGEEPAPHPGDLRAGTAALGRTRREPPIPVDLFVQVFRGYERARTRSGRIDFDDLLVETVDLLETDADAAETVRARKRWFSVDEYQDTNPLQERLLELWLGDRSGPVRRRRRGSDDLHVHRCEQPVPDRVRRSPPGRTCGDPEPTTTAPARRSWSWRTGCLPRPDATKRLETTRPDGPEPTIVRHNTDGAELAALVDWVRARIAEGTAPAGDRGARADERPARTDRGRADPRRASRTRSAASGSTIGAEVRGAIELVRRAAASGDADRDRAGAERRGSRAVGAKLGYEVTAMTRAGGRNQLRVAPATRPASGPPRSTR